MNTKSVLLTGSRAPVALDAARAFKNAGYKVICADSLSPVISQYSSSVDKHYTVSKPSEDLGAFEKELEQIIIKEEVDLLIPMCEEAVFISKIRSNLSCEVFSMGFELIEQIHNKWSFCKLLEIFSIQTPPTQLIQTDQDLKKLPLEKKLIFKRIYSRFSAEILIKYAHAELPKIKHSTNNPYIAQEYIEGDKLCSYSVVRDGDLLAYSEYRILQSMGIGAGISFVSTFHDDIYDFVKAFVKETKYTGQISFDFIRSNDGKLYCLECNPRATSGLHLFERSAQFAQVFIEKANKSIIAKPGIYKRDLFFTLWYGVKQRDFLQADFWKSLFLGQSPFFCWRDIKPFLAVPFILFHVIKMTFFQKKTFHEAMSCDIEYNGE